MGRLKVREVQSSRPDPRADGDDQPVTSAPRTSDDLMRALRATADPPPKAHAPASRGAAPGPPASEEPRQIEPGLRDLFGIVGTTQADLFRVEKVIAHGGFSVVYKAKHLRFGAPAALKCLKLPPTLTALERKDFLEKFMAEGELMFRLSSSCPEVVRPLHIDSFKLSDGQVVPFLALEWLEGETLQSRIIRRLSEGTRPLSVQAAITLLTPVARALARAHNFPSSEGRLAILHCDLKPDNIFVAQQDDAEVLKIFDFGIAKVRSAATREAGGATMASGRRSMFTPAYAAPEQWVPEQFGQSGPWTDVFALALTLTEVITQKPALDGSPNAILVRCLDPKRRPTPRTLGLTVSDELEDIFKRALAVDPRERTSSIQAFWTDLEEAAQLPPTFGQSMRMSLPSVSVPFDWGSVEARPSEAPRVSQVDAAGATSGSVRNDASDPAPAPDDLELVLPSSPPTASAAPDVADQPVVAKRRKRRAVFWLALCLAGAVLAALATFLITRLRP